MNTLVGVCRLCNEEKRLTFEHIPPRSAYNRDPVQTHELDIVEDEGLVAVPGPYQQRGAGEYRLCAECNNVLGRVYVPDYQRFVQLIVGAMAQVDGLERVNETEQFPEFYLRTERLIEQGLTIRPSRVAKQAVSMLLCVGAPGFAEKREDLRQYVLDPASPDFPDDVALGGCFFLGQRARYGGPTAMIEMGPRPVVTTYIEVAYPPLAWLLVLNGGQMPKGLADFGPWIDTEPDAAIDGFELRAQIGFAATLFPGDYRTEGQVQAHLRSQQEE